MLIDIINKSYVVIDGKLYDPKDNPKMPCGDSEYIHSLVPDKVAKKAKKIIEIQNGKLSHTTIVSCRINGHDSPDHRVYIITQAMKELVDCLSIFCMPF